MTRKIFVVKGTGFGSTKKSAFDDALKSAGIENFNLIPLSSVIPPDTELEVIEKYPKTIVPGTMQPVVMACVSSNVPDQNISAGVGWRISKENNGGIFVEVSNTEKLEVTKKELELGVKEISEHRNWVWRDKGQFVLEETIVPEGKAASIVVVAVYDFIHLWGLVLPSNQILL
ncbi:MAG: pyruvoyl-dependent arginine decarboxylase [Promethearchaeota archaeon]